VLSHSGDHFTILHNSDPLSNDILPTLEGHLYVHLPTVSLVDGGHVNVSSSVLEPTDFGLSLLYGPVEPVDAVVGFLKVLVGNGCSSTYGGNKAIGHSTCSGLEVITLIHAEDCFGGAG